VQSERVSRLEATPSWNDRHEPRATPERLYAGAAALVSGLRGKLGRIFLEELEGRQSTQVCLFVLFFRRFAAWIGVSRRTIREGRQKDSAAKAENAIAIGWRDLLQLPSHFATPKFFEVIFFARHVFPDSLR